MRDYKAIFEGIESTLFRTASRSVSSETIRSHLEPYKHYEGRQLSDDEVYTKLVHVAFYAGFRAQTVSDRIAVIDRHFPNYTIVAGYDGREMQRILGDSQMIRNSRKIQACIENARTLKALISKYGSFHKFVQSLPPFKSDRELLALREEYRRLFRYLGERTAFHFMMDVGIPVLKPDRVIERIFKRLGLVSKNLMGDPLYVALIREGEKFVQATGYPIRYVDIIFVAYGQMQDKEIGLDKGICLELNPGCSTCGASQFCDYWADHQIVRA